MFRKGSLLICTFRASSSIITMTNTGFPMVITSITYPPYSLVVINCYLIGRKVSISIIIPFFYKFWILR